MFLEKSQIVLICNQSINQSINSNKKQNKMNNPLDAYERRIISSRKEDLTEAERMLRPYLKEKQRRILSDMSLIDLEKAIRKFNDVIDQNDATRIIKKAFFREITVPVFTVFSIALCLVFIFIWHAVF